MSENLIYLKDINQNKEETWANKHGYTKEVWFKKIIGNNTPNKLKHFLEREFMNDFQKNAEEQIESLNSLFNQWGDHFKNIKDLADQEKLYLKKSGGDIRDSVEKLRQGVTNFLTVIDAEKLEKVTKNIETLTNCLTTMDSLIKDNVLDKLLTSLK